MQFVTLARRAEYTDVFCNPVTFGAYTIQQLAGYPVIAGVLPFTLRAALRAFKFTPGKFVRGYDIFFILDFRVHLQLKII